MADNASITILRNTQANINAEPIKDGNILFTTDQAKNKIYTDVGTRRIQIGGTVDVDTELSTTSTNPVQNKIVTNNINDVRGQICTNLLNPTAQTQTIDGVTFTVNDDGTVVANGTPNVATRTTFLVGWYTITDNTVLINGCPSGGASNRFELMAFANNKAASDYGNGASLSTFSVGDTVQILAVVRAGYTANNLLFKPMITTDLSATYDDFVPYTGDSGRLNEDVANLVKGISGGISPITNSEIDTILNS